MTRSFTPRRPPVVTFALPLLLVLAAACGHDKTPPPKPPVAVAAKPPPPPREVHEHVVPHMCGSRTKLAQMLGRVGPAPAPAPHDSAESAPPPTTSAGDRGFVTGPEIYRRVAPGVVFIHSKHGFGTGVVIDPKGYVLTNHHVIAGGEEKDFIVKVDVEFGELTPTGRMVRKEKNLRPMNACALKPMPACFALEPGSTSALASMPRRRCCFVNIATTPGSRCRRLSSIPWSGGPA